MIRLFAYRRSLLCLRIKISQRCISYSSSFSSCIWSQIIHCTSIMSARKSRVYPVGTWNVSPGLLGDVSSNHQPANLQMRLFRRANGHTTKSAVTHKIHGSSCLDTVCGRDVSTISLCEPEYYVLPTTDSKSRVLHSPSSRPWIRLSTRPNDEAE